MREKILGGGLMWLGDLHCACLMIRRVVTSVGDPQLIGSGFCSLAVTGCSFRSVILFSKWWITDLECSPGKFAHCPMSRTARWSLVFHAGDE